ncbi:MAG: glutaredoxin family protein [Halomonas sp.]|nr:thioredoxin family protein [Halomonas sp.]MBY5941582.1 glutaredoxin family protein [Halomonas sp. DP5N14-9]MBY6108902.1 glutaredoxin family protein [Halomonas sp. DP1Y21-3]NQY72752.1 glutaredoxin family protein [Halomonas sp.]RQW72551.1 glutaredoxin family protein [Halomonas sp. YLB-10]
MMVLTLYTTLGCHLCEQMEALVRALARVEFTIERIEISEDDTLLRRYGERIPVLIDAERPDDVLEGRVEPDAVMRWLATRGWLSEQVVAVQAEADSASQGREAPAVTASRVKGRRVFGKL